MYFRYGGATFPNNTARFDGMSSKTIYEGLMPVGYSRTWSVYVKLYGSSVTHLNSLIAQTELAFSLQGATAYLLDNNGAPTAHILGGPGSRSGCRVEMRPSYEPLTGIEMSRIRSFRVELTAEYDTVANPNLVVRFNEVVTVNGDGSPDHDYLECVIGRPIHQVLKQYTKVTVVQTGSIVGRYRYVYPEEYVAPALPIAFRKGNMSSVSRGTAEHRDGPPGFPVERNFPVNYSWTFVADRFINPSINHWRH